MQLLAGEARSGERSAAIQACNDWLRMGPGRSLPELHRRYTENHRDSPPTESLGTLKQWSSRYDWAKRAEEWDAGAEERKNTAYTEAMQTGLALAHERVNGLKRLAGFLEEQMYEQGAGGVYHNIWLPDVKIVGHGEDAEAVDIERFNAAIIAQYRGALDDLAKETGGRVQKSSTELTGKDGEALTFVFKRREDG